MVDSVINLDEIRKQETYRAVIDVFEILEDEGICLQFQNNELMVLLDALYGLYKSKDIIYQYAETMKCYFSTIAADIMDTGVSCVLFSDVIQGIMGCYELMSPVEIEREDMSQVIQKVKRKVKEADIDARGKCGY